MAGQVKIDEIGGDESPCPRRSMSSRTPVLPRLLALALALVCLAAMAWIGRKDVPVLRDVYAAVTGAEKSAARSTGNPDLDACLSKRLGDVAQMVNEGIVTAAQADSFRTRAISYCEGQFPRGG